MPIVGFWTLIVTGPDFGGRVNFSNKDELRRRLLDNLPGSPVSLVPRRLYGESPLYVLKSPVDTDGAIQLMATIKKSALKFRAYDPVENPRLSLNESRKQVSGSVGVFAHLLSPNREGATVHNALCALVCGMAMAQQKVVVMLQEEHVTADFSMVDPHA